MTRPAANRMQRRVWRAVRTPRRGRPLLGVLGPAPGVDGRGPNYNSQQAAGGGGACAPAAGLPEPAPPPRWGARPAAVIGCGAAGGAAPDWLRPAARRLPAGGGGRRSKMAAASGQGQQELMEGESPRRDMSRHGRGATLHDREPAAGLGKPPGVQPGAAPAGRGGGRGLRRRPGREGIDKYRRGGGNGPASAPVGPGHGSGSGRDTPGLAFFPLLAKENSPFSLSLRAPGAAAHGTGLVIGLFLSKKGLLSVMTLLPSPSPLELHFIDLRNFLFPPVFFPDCWF